MTADLKKAKLFAELTDDEVEALAELLEPASFGAGQQIFREGQESDGLLVVRKGSVRFSSKRAGELGRAGPGATIGGLALVVVGPREITVVAEEPTEAVRLTRTAFHRLVEDAPRAAARMLEVLLRDMSGVLRKALERLS